MGLRLNISQKFWEQLYAGMALHALISKMDYTGPSCVVDADGLAQDALVIAKAMIAHQGVDRGGYAATEQE